MPQEGLDLLNARERTRSKLRYAAVHLRALTEYPRLGSGDDFERAHFESFLFHLIGARDALLQELNIYRSCGLALNRVDSKRLQAALSRNGMGSAALEQLLDLEHDSASWLSLATELRHHSTHRWSVPRCFSIGREDCYASFIIDPRNGEARTMNYVKEFRQWLIDMTDLIDRLRAIDFLDSRT